MDWMHIKKDKRIKHDFYTLFFYQFVIKNIV